LALSDQTFIEQFESCTLDPEHFNHQGHIRIAWLYLNLFDQQTASNKICQGIAQYASSLGATEKYREDLTLALIGIIGERINQRVTTDWYGFCEANPDLLTNAKALLIEQGFRFD
jgi:hypothetical protein